MNGRASTPWLVGSVNHYLRDVPTEDLPTLFEAVLQRRGVLRVAHLARQPLGDPSLDRLLKWGLLSSRTHWGLVAECRDRFADPCLSDIVQYPAAHWERSPHLGPAGLAEIVVILEDFGWNLTGPAGPFTLPEAREKEARRKIAKRRAQQAEDHRSYDELLREMEEKGLSIKELAERYGRSAAKLGVRLRQYREWLRYCAANPLPEPAVSDAIAADEQTAAALEGLRDEGR